ATWSIAASPARHAAAPFASAKSSANANADANGRPGLVSIGGRRAAIDHDVIIGAARPLWRLLVGALGRTGILGHIDLLHGRRQRVARTCRPRQRNIGWADLVRRHRTGHAGCAANDGGHGGCDVEPVA